MADLDDEVMSTFMTPTEAAGVYEMLRDSSDSEARMLGRYIKDSVPWKH